MHRVRGRQGGRQPILLATPVVLQVNSSTTFNHLRQQVATYVPLAGVPRDHGSLHHRGRVNGGIQNTSTAEYYGGATEESELATAIDPALLPLYLTDHEGVTLGGEQVQALGLTSALVPGGVLGKWVAEDGLCVAWCCVSL
jgi:hypothetical protein